MVDQRRTWMAVCVLLCLVLWTDPASAEDDEGGDDVLYYVSLGTSLSQGVQPDENGVNQPTGDGYADQLHESLQLGLHELELVKLGCPILETSTGMIAGGEQSFCTYENGSQLKEAVAFLEAHRGSIALVTIDIGANDTFVCELTDPQCLIDVFATVRFNLETGILPALRQAVGPNVPIVGMNYYNPSLVAWIDPGGPFGQNLAIGSTQLAWILSEEFLRPAYASFDAPLADVFSAFHADDFTPGPSGLPVNVETLCALTWMCDPTVGPNIHSRASGYEVIAETFAEIVEPGDDTDEDESSDEDEDDD